MKKYYIILFVLSNILQANSQSGVISYSIKVKDNAVIETKKDSVPNKYAEMLNEAVNLYQEDFKYNLTFNPNETSFECLKIMESEKDNFKIKIAKIFFQYETVYYSNVAENEKIKQHFAYGQLFRISDSINNVKWTLINEKKVINNFLCYKAKTTKTIINSKGTFDKDIIAWYAIELPYNYGPKGNSGLPGLILELKDENNLIYYATKIKIDKKKNLEIKKPSKGKLMTAEEFEKFSLGVDISFD